ncbi:MAG: TetR/AcrR family transcriptional regulator [Ilumatobacter sp.]|uniref:TetR/AcrR family transcriptional regulator n=1 Tax=Ilumatobacter sp. TaxID=1967498 RepID=UPI003296A966
MKKQATSAARSASGASSPLTSTPLTPRGAKTRASLVKSARALFEKNGYLPTSVAEITERASVAHGTFYTYFDSKEDIFAVVADELQSDFQAMLGAEPELPPGSSISERVERTNRAYLRAYEQLARTVAVLEQVSTFNARLAEIRRTSRRFWLQRNTEAIARWKQHGIIDPEIIPEYAASMLGSMIDRSAYVWIVLGEPYEFDDAVRQLTRVYCNALRIDCHYDA